MNGRVGSGHHVLCYTSLIYSLATTLSVQHGSAFMTAIALSTKHSGQRIQPPRRQCRQPPPRPRAGRHSCIQHGKAFKYGSMTLHQQQHGPGLAGVRTGAAGPHAPVRGRGLCSRTAISAAAPHAALAARRRLLFEPGTNKHTSSKSCACRASIRLTTRCSCVQGSAESQAENERAFALARCTPGTCKSSAAC